MTSHAKRVVKDLFAMFMSEPECLPDDWRDKSGDVTVHARLVADYIAGMTDRYALREHHRLFDLYSPSL
jgi:dGTPase